MRPTHGPLRWALRHILALTFAVPFLCTAWCLGGTGFLRDKPHPSQATDADWQVDLRLRGYVPPQMGEGLQPPLEIDPVSFISDGTVVVTFVTPPPQPEFTHRASPALSLHALFVDSKNGEVLRTQEWPTADYRSRLIPAGEGKLLVLTPDLLSLYSAQMQLIRTLDLSLSQRARKGDWTMVPSRTGRSLYVKFGPRANDQEASDDRIYAAAKEKNNAAFDKALCGSREHYEWVDTERMQVLDETEQGVCSGTPHDFLDPFYLSERPDLPMMQSVRDAFCGEGAWLGLCYPDLEPVSSDTVFARAQGNVHVQTHFEVIRTNGKKAFGGDIPPSEFCFFIPSIRSSALGNRFALAIAQGRGGGGPLDLPGKEIFEEILVFDLTSNRWIYKLDLKKPVKAHSQWGLALSPDGSLIALLDEDGILRLYHLPDSAPTNPIKP